MADALDGDGVRGWVAEFVHAFAAERVALDELDRRSGDGDFGSNLLPAVERVGREVAADPGASAGDTFTILSTAFMHAGGTSGPLFGIWFREFARASAASGRLDREALAVAAANGLAAVQSLGKAGLGDKTMVDAMSPAADALAGGAGAPGDVGEGLAAAAAAARQGADATAALVARRGRASYIGDLSRGVRDPGAEAVAMFFEAAARSLAARSAPG